MRFAKLLQWTVVFVALTLLLDDKWPAVVFILSLAYRREVSEALASFDGRGVPWFPGLPRQRCRGVKTAARPVVARRAMADQPAPAADVQRPISAGRTRSSTRLTWVLLQRFSRRVLCPWSLRSAAIWPSERPAAWSSSIVGIRWRIGVAGLALSGRRGGLRALAPRLVVEVAALGQRRRRACRRWPR